MISMSEALPLRRLGGEWLATFDERHAWVLPFGAEISLRIINGAGWGGLLRELSIKEVRTMNGGKDKKIRSTPMTKAERARKRAEKEEETVQRLRKFAEEPPSRLDQLLKKLGRPPTLERQMREA